MSGAPDLTATAQQELVANARHQTWYVVVQPTIVVAANGQPGQKMIGAFEIVEQAFAAAQANPGSMVITNTVIYVSGQVVAPAAPAAPIIRRR